MARSISLLIKPVSSKCNLMCSYCFYRDEAANRTTADHGAMSYETIDAIAAKALTFAGGGRVTLAFQGGEPLLAGISFYKHLIETVTKLNNSGTKVMYTLQTNATLIDKEYAQFFVENDFLLGVSLDGYEDINDLYRSSYQSVIKGLRLLKEYKVQYNVLCVVTKQSAKNITEIYKFYRRLGIDFMQFIPCIEPLHSHTSSKYTLASEDYGNFLIKLFDLWKDDIYKGNNVSIRYFDNLIGIVNRGEAYSCDMKGKCSCQFVTESDGSVYPCDFYALDKYCIGNILNDSFEGMYNSNVCRQFILDSIVPNEKCNTCPFYNYCRGGCRRYRKDGMYTLCEGTRMFLSERLYDIKYVAAKYFS